MGTGGTARGPIDSAVLEQILDITRQLATPFELEEILARVVDAGRAVLEADRGTVFLYDAERDELVVHVGTGLAAVRLPADRGIVGQCVRTRSAINVPDCYADPRFDPAMDLKTGYRTRCLLTLPLIGHDGAMVGALQLLNKRGGVFDERDERIATTLAAQAAVALERVRMTEQLVVKEKLDRELALAREIQTGFMPRRMPQLAGYDIAGLCRPADATGGDIFDFVPTTDGGLLLLLGDATGHGVGPALSVTQVRAMVRMATRLRAGLDQLYAQINDQLEQDLASNRLVTAFVGELDATTHRLAYHAAGQGPLLQFHAARGAFEWRGATTFPMGFLAPVRVKGPAAFDLAPGDVVALLTDGVFECANPADEEFGQAGVERLLAAHHGLPMAELATRLLDAVDEFKAGAPQADDITIVLLRRLP